VVKKAIFQEIVHKEVKVVVVAEAVLALSLIFNIIKIEIKTINLKIVVDKKDICHVVVPLNKVEVEEVDVSSK